MEEGVTGMGNVISSLTTAISTENLWGAVGSAVPLIAVAVLFALAFGVVRRLIKGISNRKAKV